jgi:hypothetical protein
MRRLWFSKSIKAQSKVKIKSILIYIKSDLARANRVAFKNKFGSPASVAAAFYCLSNSENTIIAWTLSIGLSCSNAVFCKLACYRHDV